MRNLRSRQIIFPVVRWEIVMKFAPLGFEFKLPSSILIAMSTLDDDWMESLCESFPSTVSSPSLDEGSKKEPWTIYIRIDCQMKFLFCHHLSLQSYTIRRQFKHSYSMLILSSFTVKYQEKSLMSDWFNSSRKKLNWVFCTSYEYHSLAFFAAILKDWGIYDLMGKWFREIFYWEIGEEEHDGKETRKIHERTAWKGIILEEILKRTIIIRFMFRFESHFFLLDSLHIDSIDWFLLHGKMHAYFMLNHTD